MGKSCETKCSRMWPKIMPQSTNISAKMHPTSTKVDKTGAQERSKSDPGGKSVAGSQKVRWPDAFVEPFRATWVIWGAILGPAGPEGAPKITLFRQKTT